MVNNGLIVTKIKFAWNQAGKKIPRDQSNDRLDGTTRVEAQPALAQKRPCGTLRLVHRVTEQPLSRGHWALCLPHHPERGEHGSRLIQ